MAAPSLKKSSSWGRRQKQGAGSKPEVPGTLSADTFRNNKKDKRLIKHHGFVSRIEKSQSATKKRRRPAKKLAANLEALADALPDAGQSQNGVFDGQVSIIRQKSLKSRPGALKRKEKLDKLERERFSKNMAQMAGIEPDTTADTLHPGGEQTTARWAVLKNFISQTMEKKPEMETAKK